MTFRLFGARFLTRGEIDLDTLLPTINLMAHLRDLELQPPHRLLFTISPVFFTKYGSTLGMAAMGRGQERKTSITRRDDAAASASSWRPSSIFGGIFASSVDPVKELAEEEEESIENGTIKATTLPDSPEPAAVSTASSRLSTLFTDWVSPTADPVPDRSVKNRVGKPSGLIEGGEKRFATISGAQRTQLAGLGVSIDETGEEVEAGLEKLMVMLVLRLRFDSTPR